MMLFLFIPDFFREGVLLTCFYSAGSTLVELHKKLKQLIDEEVSWKWVNGHVLAEKILSVIVVHCYSSFQCSVLDSIVLLSVCLEMSLSLCRHLKPV